MAVVGVALVLDALATGASGTPVLQQAMLPQQPRVPALVGLPVDSAIRLLDRMKIRHDASVRVASSQPYNSVVRQAPDPGTPVQAGMVVQLAISSGGGAPSADSVVVPDLVGQDKLGVVVRLTLAKVTTGTVDSVLDEAYAGKVIRQAPGAGTRVPKGSPVALWFGYASAVTVPDLRDSTVRAAARILDATGLKLGNRDSTPVDGTPGLVLRQQPAARKQVPRGSSVRIWYGYARPVTVQVESLVVVPDVTGRDTGHAELVLTHAGLTEGRVEAVTAESAPGLVLRQVPPAGTRVPPGTAIGLQVAAPPSRVGVPQVVGLPESKAVHLIEAAGLLAVPITHSSRPSGNHQVVTQRPEAGSMVARGSAVALDVAVPLPPPARVIVPHVEGRTPTEADAILENVELHLGNVVVIETTATANRVLRQAPPADAVVDTGTDVSLTVSKPLRRDTVPEVRGQRQTAAESTLAAHHFTITVTDSTSVRADSGRVLNQDPPGGTEVSPGSEVELLVGVYVPAPLWVKLLVALAGIGGGAYGVVRLRGWRSDRPWQGRVTITPRGVPAPPGRIDTDNLLTGPEVGLVPRATPISTEMVEDEPLIEGESS